MSIDLSFLDFATPAWDHLEATARGAVVSRNASDPAYPVPPKTTMLVMRVLP